MEETCTWADSVTAREIEALGEKINDQGFNHVFQVTADGIAGGPGGVYAPESVEHDATHDILIEGVPYKERNGGWWPLTGHTNQDRYHGAVLHDSEFVGGGLARDIIERSAEWERDDQPLLWTMVVVRDPDDEDHDAGWAVLYRDMP